MFIYLFYLWIPLSYLIEIYNSKRTYERIYCRMGFRLNVYNGILFYRCGMSSVGWNARAIVYSHVVECFAFVIVVVVVFLSASLTAVSAFGVRHSLRSGGD